jgi:ankyrin repeat protein
MIRPVELSETREVVLPTSGITSSDDVWQIFASSRDGDLPKVKELVDRFPDLATWEYNYTPPIHFAVREGHIDVVRYLLDHNADPTYRSYCFDDSLLTMAQDRGHHEVAQLLLDILSRRFPIKPGLEEFLDIASRGDLQKLQQALARDPELATASNDTGDTALHKAAERGHLELVNALIDAGAVVDAIRADGVRPINCALRFSRWNSLRAGAIVGVLLSRGASYNIYLASMLGDHDYVRKALASDSSLANFEDSSHSRPISAAASRNDMELVRLLLDHGANPSLPEGGAPLGEALWKAVYQRQTEMAKLLLEHGANPNTAPESSGSALFQARGDSELTRLLLEYGAEDKTGDLVEFQRMIGDNNLSEVESQLKKQPELIKNQMSYWAEGIMCGPASGGRFEMLELLIRFGATVPAVSKWGRFYYFKHYDVAVFLLKNGMNPNHMNWHHITLLHDMAQSGDIKKAQLLLDYGADINAVDEEYRTTPLGMAARWGQHEMCDLLLERGADPNKSSADWATPLEWARKKGHVEIESKLKDQGAQ